jgi:hypothetical protein
LEKPQRELTQHPKLEKNFYQRKTELRGRREASERQKLLVTKLSHLNNFDTGFLQHSPTLRFQHLFYFISKQRQSFPGFDALSEVLEIDKINAFFKDKELWKNRMSQHMKEYQVILNYVERSRRRTLRERQSTQQFKKLKRNRNKTKGKKQFEFLQELLVEKEFFIDLEKTYQKSLAKFEQFMLKYLRRIYYGSPISDDFKELYEKFDKKLTEAQDYLQIFNTYCKEKLIEYRSKKL